MAVRPFFLDKVSMQMQDVAVYPVGTALPVEESLPYDDSPRLAAAKSSPSMLLLTVAAEIDEILRQGLARKAVPTDIIRMENQLNRQLQGLFDKAGTAVVDQLLAHGTMPSDPTTRARVIADLEAQRETFQNAIHEKAEVATDIGREVTNADIKRAGQPLRLNEFSEQTRQRLTEHIFDASRQTFDRMVGDVMGTLGQAYSDGLGIDEAAVRLRDKFKGMKDWELGRVARTEIGGAQNAGSQQTMEDLGVSYQEWVCAVDGRQRPSHNRVNGEITALSTSFSNGMQHPGDRSGRRVHEFINCRCRAVPFFVPPDKVAPGRGPFRSGDLIAKEQPAEPTPPGGVVGNSDGLFGSKGTGVASYSASKSERDAFMRDNSVDAGSLSKEQLGAVAEYKSGNFRRINNNLRGGAATVPPEVEHLDAVIGSNKLKSNAMVYRGVKDSASVANLKPGDVFTDKGYSSTTLNPGVAQAFAVGQGTGVGRGAGGGAIVSIRAPKGSSAAAMHGSKLGNSSEQEVLLPRNSNFKVVGTGTAKVFTNAGKAYDVPHIVMELVP